MRFPNQTPAPNLLYCTLSYAWPVSMLPYFRNYGTRLKHLSQYPTKMLIENKFCHFIENLLNINLVFIHPLIHFMQLVSFSTHQKHKKPEVFREFRKRPIAWNWLKSGLRYALKISILYKNQNAISWITKIKSLLNTDIIENSLFSCIPFWNVSHLLPFHDKYQMYYYFIYKSDFTENKLWN